LDLLHKAAQGLVAHYGQIGVEDLLVKNMISRSKINGHRRAKAGLSRAIGDASWSQFVRVLEHRATKAGVES
jgi:IS605 OrfB family transposase